MSWETKNKCGRSELTSQLYMIERERKDDVRIHDTMAQQFKCRKSVLNFYLDKTGKRRLESRSSVCYEDIHDMLFTDGELDVDKILCLHLLTAHRAETLTPPARSRRPISFLAKDQSPLEKLIERSRKHRTMSRCPKLTPTYVLDNILDVDNEQKEMIRDGRLAERTIINDKIMLLIQTVLEALQVSNPEKMIDLQRKAQDVDVLMKIAQKPAIQEFLHMLRKQLIVSSCESFHLTQPFKAATVPLQVAPSALSLKSLVNYIRGNVLQNPSQSTWGDMYDREVGSKEEMISSYFYEKSHNSIDGLSSGSKSETRAEESEMGNLTRRTMDPKTSTVTVEEDDDDASIRPKRRKPPITNLEEVDDDDTIDTIGVDRLAVIVDFHMRKLNFEEKRASNIQKSPSLRVYKNTTRGRVGSRSSNDSVELNVYDLAKISQEIRQKETQQKFERFLKEA